MTHRERVMTALNHERPDRCPMQVSFTPEFAERVRSDMGIDAGALHNPHGGGNTYLLERELGEDMLLTSVGWANSYYATQDLSADDETYIDEWGVGFQNAPYETPFGTGAYTEIVGHPLAEDAAIDSYDPPDPNRPELYTAARQMIDAFQDEYWIVGVTVTTVFETAWALRGLDRILIDMATNADYVDRLLNISHRYHLAAARRLVEMGVDMIWIGDDVGAQNRMMISPDMWRRFLRPKMAEFVSQIKAINPKLVVAYHSDGNIEPIVDDLIDVGIDVLNPVQPRSMDPAALKRRYGKKLCFWGTIDEQHTLPFGSPADVEAEVRTRLETVGKNGGLIIGPTHHVQLDTPMENFRAMIDTIVNTPCR